MALIASGCAPLRYMLSFYFVFTTMTTVGYGDVSPHTYSEYVFSMWIMFVGTVVFGAQPLSTHVAIVD